MGSLMGYGLGSFWGGGFHSFGHGCGGYPVGGGGFGGGYIQVRGYKLMHCFRKLCEEQGT